MSNTASIVTIYVINESRESEKTLTLSPAGKALLNEVVPSSLLPIQVYLNDENVGYINDTAHTNPEYEIRIHGKHEVLFNDVTHLAVKRENSDFKLRGELV